MWSPDAKRSNASATLSIGRVPVDEVGGADGTGLQPDAFGVVLGEGGSAALKCGSGSSPCLERRRASAGWPPRTSHGWRPVAPRSYPPERGSRPSDLLDCLTRCLSRTTLASAGAAGGRRTRLSEKRGDKASTPQDEAGEAGATSEGFGNLSIEDDAEGTVHPADLAHTDVPDDAVDS